MTEDELYSKGVFASELNDDTDAPIDDEDPEELDLDDEDEEDGDLDDAEASYNPLDDIKPEEWA